MQDLLNKIDRLLKEKKFFEVKNIVKDENAADLAVLFDELFGEVFGEKTEFMILFRLLPKDLAAETFAHMNSDMQSHLIQMFSDKEIRYNRRNAGERCFENFEKLNNGRA